LDFGLPDFVGWMRLGAGSLIFSQIYRFMNGMDGVTIDREKVGSIAGGSFGAAKVALDAWLAAEGGAAPQLPMLMPCWTTSGLFCMAWLCFTLIVTPRTTSSEHNTALSDG